MTAVSVASSSDWIQSWKLRSRRTTPRVWRRRASTNWSQLKFLPLASVFISRNWMLTYICRRYWKGSWDLKVGWLLVWAQQEESQKAKLRPWRRGATAAWVDGQRRTCLLLHPPSELVRKPPCRYCLY